jgi:hypothetical protein
MLIGVQITATISEAAARRLGGSRFVYLGRGPLLAMITWGKVTLLMYKGCATDRPLM